MQIDFIRHTTPDIETGICYGQSDLALVESFEQEFEVVHKKLRDCYDVIYSSPLQRCAQLATTLTGEQIIHDDRIMEYNFGDWELLPWKQLKGDVAQQWMDNYVDHPAPNGDSLKTLENRVLDFWSDVVASNHQHIAVVTHSGVQRIIHSHILHSPLKNLFRLELDFGAVIRVKHDPDSGLSTLKHL